MDLVRRSAWGARPPKGRPIPIAVPVAQLVLHHSAGPDGGPEVVRGIQKFHQQTRGWSDIAYTWIYSPVHRMLFEGRGHSVSQAAQAGHNRNSHSICVLGNYERTPPPSHVIDDLAELARWHDGAHLGPATYVGHRDLNVTNTACPGRHLASLLPMINQLATGTTPPPAPPPPASMPPTVRRGDRGDDVRLAQAGVGATVDGIFGPATESAVRTFQRNNGLHVDGIVGPATWRVILT